jgi:Flp pilus assembly protein TadG
MQQHDHGERLMRGHADARSRGQSLVEFALVLPLFLLLFFAIVDMGRAVFVYNSVTNAAREGARLAIVNQDTTSITNRAKQQVSIAETVNPSVTINFYVANTDGTPSATTCPSGSPYFGCVAVVSFETTFRPLTPIIGNIVFKNGVTLTAMSSLTVEYDCPNTQYPTAAQCPKQP